MKQRGIIILASERSGSNLLRTLLGNHKEISAPVAPHMMHEFYNMRYYYGDLRINKNLKKLYKDMVDFVNHPYHDWQLDFIWNEEKIKTNNIHSFVKLFEFIYQEKALQDKKVHYCTKEIFVFNFIDQLRSELNDITFIHLVRDPRDHAASWMKNPIALFTPYDAVTKWCKEQNKYLDAVKSKGLNSFSVKYEDLIEKTEETMTKVLSFLELPVDENCFQTNTQKNKEVEWNPLWKNLAKPVLASNKGKYKEVLSSKDISIIETMAKNEMQYFGYDPETNLQWKPPKNFIKKLKKERKRNKKQHGIQDSEKLKKLNDKIKFKKSIKTKREEEWRNSGFYNHYRSKIDQKITVEESKTKCLQTFAHYLIGLKTTKKISSLFRK